MKECERSMKINVIGKGKKTHFLLQKRSQIIGLYFRF